MKKWIIMALGVAALHSVQGQTMSQQQTMPDNWYVGVHAGLNTKTTHNNLLNNLNPSVGLRMGYELTPRFGFMVEGTLFFGDAKFGLSRTFVKAGNFDLLATYNLTHAIAGYSGQRYPFEVRALLGLGVNYIYDYPISANNNDLIAKVGFDIGFNLGKQRQLYVYLQPALNYNLDHYSRTQFNINYSALQLAVGANYRFNWERLFSKPPFTKHEKQETKVEKWRDEPTAAMQQAQQQLQEQQLQKELKQQQKELKQQQEALEKEQKQRQKALEKDQKKRAKQQKALEEQKQKALEKQRKEQAKQQKALTNQQQNEQEQQKEMEQKMKELEQLQRELEQQQKELEQQKQLQQQQQSAVEISKAEQPVVVEPVVVQEQPKQSSKEKEKAQKQSQSTKVEVTPMQAAQKQQVAEKFAKVDQVGAYLKSHPKAKVVIRGEESQAKEAANQLARRFGISLTRIEVVPAKVAAVTFEIK